MNSDTHDILVQGLSKSYKENNIIKNLSVKIPCCTKVAVTGPSGAGKSTLINILMGFVAPDSGKINLLGHELSEKTVHEIRKKISWIPQELYVDINFVRDLLMLPFYYHHNKRSKPDNENIKAALNRFGLNEEILNSETGEISGGEKQRIFLSAASLLNRKIYFLDEPTSALDPDSKQKVINYFLEQCDSTVVAVTHDEDWIKNSQIVIDMNENNLSKI